LKFLHDMYVLLESGHLETKYFHVWRVLNVPYY
jgi:hypothetical protein